MQSWNWARTSCALILVVASLVCADNAALARVPSDLTTAGSDWLVHIQQAAQAWLLR